jgi:hypothetical protein
MPATIVLTSGLALSRLRTFSSRWIWSAEKLPGEALSR